MKRRATTLTGISAAVLAGVLALSGCGAAPGETSPSPDATALSPEATPAGPFDFVATTTDGDTLDGASLKHKDVVLWFWAPWCPTCRVEGRDHVSEAIDSLPEGVEFVGIAGMVDDPDAVGEFIEWTGTSGATHVVDEDGSIWSGFEVLLQPAFYFVNDDGRFERAGAGLTAEDIMEHVDWLVAE